MSLRAQIRAMFVLPLVAVLALQFAMLQYDRQADRHSSEIERLESWRENIHQLYQVLLEAESAVRGYRLGGAVDQAHLVPYFAALRQAPQLVRELRPLAAGAPQLTEHMRQLEELVAGRLSSLARLRRLPLELPPGNVIVTAQAEEGRRLTGLIREELEHFIDEEARMEAVRRQGREAVAELGRVLQLAVPALLLLTFLLVRGTTSRLLRRLDLVGRNITDVVQGAPLVPLPEDSAESRRLNASMAEAEALLHRRERESTLSREEAERANAAKTAFLSRMSHELRTPLTAVLGFSELLEMDDLTPQQRDSVRHIRTAGAHLLTLINEVLDISRIESGNLAVSIEPIELGPVVADALAIIRPMAEERGVRLPRASGRGMFVRADRQRLSQVLLNLLSNAVKYNRDFGEIRLRCVAEGEVVRVAVTDTGLGIPPDMVPRVFNPFDRLGAERTGVEGTGVGLVLSRGLVEAMGGSLTFVSVPGEGTTFTVRLPAAAEPSPLPQAPAPDVPEWLPRSSPAGPTDGSRRVTVLYVEDNAANLDLVSRYLSQMPAVDLITTMQGRLAVDLARLHRPDLILLDLHLPDLDGESVLRRLREDPHTATVPVAILTADATPGQERRLRAQGADHFLHKPLDFARLAALLDPRGPVVQS
ncbi:MAG TPA: ATP-binding protein [Egibacteraceae bacterium]|nr:ATP-binding protein [Egibacteraceae bacterium]